MHPMKQLFSKKQLSSWLLFLSLSPSLLLYFVSFSSCLQSVSHSSIFEIDMNVVNDGIAVLLGDRRNEILQFMGSEIKPHFYMWLMITLIECSERFHCLQFVVMSNEMSIWVMNIHHFSSHFFAILAISNQINKQTWPEPKKIIRDLSKRKEMLNHIIFVFDSVVTLKLKESQGVVLRIHFRYQMSFVSWMWNVENANIWNKYAKINTCDIYHFWIVTFGFNPLCYN